MRRASQCLALSLASALVPATNPCAAAVQDALPPPGFYRVDVDSDTNLGKGTVITRSHVDGVSGDRSGKTALAGAGARETQTNGSSPSTQCIRPGTAPLGGLGLPGNCTQQASTPSADAGVHTATCPTGKFKMTVRMLRKDVWEIVSETGQVLASVPANMSFMRPVLEHEAKYAAREEDRKKAAKSLADLVVLDKQMAAKQEETLKILAAAEKNANERPEAGPPGPQLSQLLGARTMNVRIRKVLTRISDTCPAPR
jgi:hypothetical protein